MNREELNFLPISINIIGKRILIIGGGRVGYHKATILNRFTEKAVVISRQFHEGFATLPFDTVEKEYEPGDLEGAFLVYACTENEELNAKIKQDAAKRGILASVCDNPVLCDFVSPAIYKEDNVTIAVSSNARNVYQSIHIRNRIQELVTEGKLKIKDEEERNYF